MNKEWRARILWAGLVPLGSVSLPILGVDVEKFALPAWMVSALWAAWITAVFYEFKPVFLGWFGKNSKTTLELWDDDKGRGDLAAELIEEAQNFSSAEKIFNHCRYDKQPRKLAMTIDAMADRLIREGRTVETMPFLENEDLGTSYQLAVDRLPNDGATDTQYLWAVTVFRCRSKDQA